MAQKQQVFIDCDNFNELCLEFTNLVSNKFLAGQLISQPLYRYPKVSIPADLVVRTPFVEMTQYGIPPISEFLNTEEKRAFVKIPLDPNQPEITNFIRLFEKIDDYVIKHKNEILGSAVDPDQYEYLTCVKQPYTKPGTQDDDQNQDEFVANNKRKEKKKQTEFFRFVKLKLGINYTTKKITTHIFVRESMEDQPKKIEPKNMDDLMNNYLTLGSKIRMVVSVNRLWAQELKNDVRAQYKQFGIVMRIQNMEILLNPKKVAKEETDDPDAFAQYAF